MVRARFCVKASIFSLMQRGEWGMGNGEWGMGIRNFFPSAFSAHPRCPIYCSHSALKISLATTQSS
ncbi:hypothetical protein FD724_03570 [Nostoc sp. C057]|nr:hypothetical protein FD724_03570 [Nostoc sp. C057]